MKVNVKILGISCGHRKGRNTAWMTLYALKAVEKACRRMNGTVTCETALIDFADRKKKIKSCAGCPEQCLRDGTCPIDDDYVARELLPRMAEADGYIIGAPVYTGSYTSNFSRLFERLRAGIARGYYANKPSVGITTASMIMGGQETCLGFMELCMRRVGMIPVHWLNGATGVSGPPNGPLPGDDTGEGIAAKNDRFGQWASVLCGRRVTEVAVMQKIARERLGELHDREFVKALPRGGAAASDWTGLDLPEEQYLGRLDRDALKDLDGKVAPYRENAGNGVKVKILGISCDQLPGSDTAYLVVRSLKAIEKFGRRMGSIGGFETEFIDLADKKLLPCIGCDKRNEIPHGGKPWKDAGYPQDFGCVIKRGDFLAEELFPRFKEADGFIFGSPVTTMAPSSLFRILQERLCGITWKGFTARKPTANIAVAYDDFGGQEACLNMMNTCNRWVELVPVSWLLGTAARGGREEIRVRNDTQASWQSVANARRVAELALSFKLAQRELGDVYANEFFRIVHPPHGTERWEWTRLDPEEDAYMKGLTVHELDRLGK